MNPKITLNPVVSTLTIGLMAIISLGLYARTEQDLFIYVGGGLFLLSMFIAHSHVKKNL